MVVWDCLVDIWVVERVLYHRGCRNLKFNLLNARLGLLARQNDAARTDLQAVAVALKKYFDPNAKKTQQALLLLEKAQSLSKGNPIPRLDGSLAALATASAGK
jgi:uroporphyrin-3 C-methyltransferase